MQRKLQPGDVHAERLAFSVDQVRLFAELSGDRNPIHFDAEAAARTPFGRPIVPGLLSASVFTKVFGMDFPGHGTVYLSQSLRFRRPLFVGESYRAHFKVLEVEPERHRAVIETNIVDEDGELCLVGEARVQNPERL